jgi:hypothetical protein
MVRKISRTGEIRSQLRHRALVGPGAVLLLAYVLMFQFAGSVYAHSATLAWDPNTDPDLAGYKVYRSEQSGVFTPPSRNSSLLTTTSFTDTTVQNGHTYYYAVTAVSTSGLESVYSAQVQAVIGPGNLPPTVNAGLDQTITLPATATLTAAATDDGLPNGLLTYQWTIVSGTGVTLTTPNSASTKVSFTLAGAYTFRVTASDGQLSRTDDVIVTVNAGAITNKAPVVNAGSDQTITFPATATLTATASDDGLPNAALTYQWMVVSGTGVTLTTPNSASTIVSFAAAGVYTLRMTVNDGQLSASDDVIVNVASVALTLTISKGGTITGSITPILAQTTNTQVQKLELLIDGRVEATVNGTSLSYRWKTRKQTGSHSVRANAYIGQVLVGSQTVIVNVL